VRQNRGVIVAEICHIAVFVVNAFSDHFHTPVELHIQSDNTRDKTHRELYFKHTRFSEERFEMVPSWLVVKFCSSRLSRGVIVALIKFLNIQRVVSHISDYYQW
jgi:hypothetical protein